MENSSTWTNFYLTKNKNVYNTYYMAGIVKNALDILIYLLSIMGKRRKASNFQQLSNNCLFSVLLIIVPVVFGTEQSILSH